MFATLVLSLSSLLPVTAQETGLTLHESRSGATVTLPEDWVVAKGEGGLMAHSEGRDGFVLLIPAERDFEELRKDVRTLILSRLDDVELTAVEAEGVDQRGAIEELVVARGAGISKLDGAEVAFAGLLVKSEGKGALVLGAWKDERNRETVAAILESLHVEDSAGVEGLVVGNATTGASVTIPSGWEILRSRKGLVAVAPNRRALAILMSWQDDFQASLDRMRATLLRSLFTEIEIGEFAVVEASYGKQLERVVAANGSAVDRVDELPVEFTVLRLQRVDANQGAALFGVWKDEQHAELVAELMSSIRIQEPKTK